MSNACIRDEHDRETCAAYSQRPLDVLDVHEERFVQQSRPLERGARDRQRSTVSPPDLAELVVAIDIDAAGVPEPRVERRARVLHGHAVREEDLAGEQTCVGPRRRGRRQCVRQAWLGECVVVQQQHPVGAPLERPANAHVVAPGEAQVRTGANQFDLREALRNDVVRSVGRSIVDADCGHTGERVERSDSVIAAVPVEDDGDEVHALLMKCAIEPAFGCRSQPAPISEISRTTPG